jgi:hypothetical protein
MAFFSETLGTNTIGRINRTERMIYQHAWGIGPKFQASCLAEHIQIPILTLANQEHERFAACAKEDSRSVKNFLGRYGRIGSDEAVLIRNRKIGGPGQ